MRNNKWKIPAVIVAAMMCLGLVASDGSKLIVYTATTTDDRLAISVTAGGAAQFTSTETNADFTANRTITRPDESGTIVVRPGTASQTDKSTAIAATTLCTPTVDGFYRVSAYLKITTVGTSPVAGPITITYTDATGSQAQSHVMGLFDVNGAVVTTTVNNSVTTGTVHGSIVMYAKAAVPIQYAVAVSGTYNSGRYAVQLRCEAV